MSSYFHSASPSCPILSANCRYNLRQVRLFRGDSSDIWGMDKSSSATCLLYSDVVKGKKISKRTKKKPWRKRQSRSSRFSFHKYFTTFFYLFLFWITLLYHIFFLLFFFTHEIYPHPHPLPTTSTHYPRPTTFSYTRLEGIPRANRPRPIFTNYASILRHFKPSHKTNILGSHWTPTDSELRSSVFRATGGKRKSIILQINVQNVERLTCWRFLQECYFRSSAQNSRVEPWQVKEILIPLFLTFLTLQCRSLSVSRLIFLLSVGGNSVSHFVSSQPF